MEMQVEHSSPKEIGFRIRRAREAKGLTQEDLGGLASCSRAWINRVEKGHGRASSKTMQRIANSLDKPVDHFLHGEPVVPTGDLPSSTLRAVLARVQRLSLPQQERLGRIMEQILHWPEPEPIHSTERSASGLSEEGENESGR